MPISKITIKQFVKEILHNPLYIFEYSIFRYLFIGGLTFTLDFGIYQLFISWVHWQEVPSNLASVFVSLFFNFTLSNFWTFRAGKANSSKKIGRYALLATFNYFFNNLVFAFLVGGLNLNGLVAKVIVTMAIVCWNFVLYKTWIFKN